LLAEKTGWPTLYDVTDDWLLASCTERERLRRIRDEALLMALAREVVVCSPGLVTTKGRYRPVKLVTNGVDSEWVRCPTARPSDMPAGPVACYVGTLHEDRLDVELCLRVADHLKSRGSLLLVGPDALTIESRGALIGKGNVLILGSRSHAAVPGYLQHADVLVVPHRRTPFTESLDPIKAYEYRAVGRPVVATPVAGFRDLGPPVTVAEDSDFADAVLAAVPGCPPPPILLDLPSDLPTWLSQGMKMHEALLRVASARDGSTLETRL
jgi:glycosyltransferase involved in cell wall biosynthesis